jgi:hypothetical protein
MGLRCTAPTAHHTPTAHPPPTTTPCLPTTTSRPPPALHRPTAVISRYQPLRSHHRVFGPHRSSWLALPLAGWLRIPSSVSQNNRNLPYSPREKAAIRGDQRGAWYLSVCFTCSARFQLRYRSRQRLGQNSTLPRSENNSNFSSTAQKSSSDSRGSAGFRAVSSEFSILYSQRIQPTL